MECPVLKCRDVTELATDYLDGAMSPTGRMAMRWHLVLCRNCRAFLGQVRRTRDLLGRIRPPLAPETEDSVMEKLTNPPTRTEPA